MKTIILLLLTLSSSCATISEYNQGCRDGLAFHAGSAKDEREAYCNYLDKVHRLENKEYK